MAFASAQAQRNSLPNRSPTRRPRSLSLSGYQPLPFDREATSLAYQAQLQQPSISDSSSYTRTTPNASSSSGYFEQAGQSSSTHSSLSQHLKEGDNPHISRTNPISIAEVGRNNRLGGENGNVAGVGAGHSLSPPNGAFLEAQRNSLNLSGAGGSPLKNGSTQAPLLPRRPERHPGRSAEARWSTQGTVGGSGTGYGNGNGNGMERIDCGHYEEDGYESDPGYPRYIGGRSGGRKLPAVPTNVPAPAYPDWEPDYKPQIPSELTQASMENAYAQPNPPPGLPPRPRPELQTAGSGPGSSSAPLSTGSSRPLDSPSTPLGPATPLGNHPQSSAASRFPFDLMPPRPAAEESVNLKADGRTPIWSTHYLDPSLRNPLINIPPKLSSMTNMALSSLVSSSKDTATATQVDAATRKAKAWFVPPDGKFVSDKGAIELGLGVIDSGVKEGDMSGVWGRDKGRRRARVEVATRTGGVKLDLIELDDNRQVDIKVETKTGDIVILLPRNFVGSINITTPGPDPHFCRMLRTSLTPIQHPYETVYTTTISPPSNGTRNDQTDGNRGSVPMKKQRWVPEFLRPQEEILPAGHINEGWSKVNVVTQGSKARVVLGYREEDEVESKGSGAMVGMEGQEKKKRWWRA